MQLPLSPPIRSIVDRERHSLNLHRETMRGSAFPSAHPSTPPTFLHGFLLPFSLLAATLRHPTLGLIHLKVTVLRALVVLVLGVAVFSSAKFTRNAPHVPRGQIVVDHGSLRTLHVGPGPVAPVAVEAVEPAMTPTARMLNQVTGSWTWILWFVSVLSIVEAVVVFVSRRWDDWIAFHVAALARIRSDDPFPIPPRLELFDRRWLWKKAFRRARGYVMFGAGLPLFLVFRLIPTFGNTLFTIASILWGWYWLGVFSASKSGHAWIDEAVAPSPYLIRELRDRSTSFWSAPIRIYARIWSWLARGVNAPVMTFERCPAPFLGLGLARFILSFPGLYQFSRAVVPVAAGRLCAETDPQRRFSL